MIADCFCYYKGCEECQRFGTIHSDVCYYQGVAILEDRWGHPLSPNGYLSLQVGATYYFTKCTKVVPLENMTHEEVIEFITEVI